MAAAADELGHGEDTRAMDRRAGLGLPPAAARGLQSAERGPGRAAGKDMAALARRGFSYDICLAVVEARDEDDLRDRLSWISISDP